MSRRVQLVRDPHGMDWKVRIAWQPRHAALWRRFGGWSKNGDRGVDFSGVDYVPTGTSPSSSGSGGFLDDLGDDLLVGLLVLVAVVVAGALLWWVLIPLLLVVVDLLVVLVLLAAGTLARVALGRPWVVEAVPRRGVAVQVPVRGWRNARRAEAHLRAAIVAGQPLDAATTLS